MAKEKKIEQEEPLEKKLWKAADKLRKNMDAAEYKHVVLGLIFLKYISDAFKELYNLFKEDKGNYEVAHRAVANLVNEETPDWIRDRKNNIFSDGDWDNLKKTIKEERESLFWQFKLNDDYYDESYFFDEDDIEEIIATNSIRHMEDESNRFANSQQKNDSIENNDEKEIDELFVMP